MGRAGRRADAVAVGKLKTFWGQPRARPIQAAAMSIRTLGNDQRNVRASSRRRRRPRRKSSYPSQAALTGRSSGRRRRCARRRVKFFPFRRGRGRGKGASATSARAGHRRRLPTPRPRLMWVGCGRCRRASRVRASTPAIFSRTSADTALQSLRYANNFRPLPGKEVAVDRDAARGERAAA